MNPLMNMIYYDSITFQTHENFGDFLDLNHKIPPLPQKTHVPLIMKNSFSLHVSIAKILTAPAMLTKYCFVNQVVNILDLIF